MASSSRVTPRAVVSPVSTGWLQLVWTKDWAARLYTSDGRWSRNTATRDPSSSRSPATRVNRSWMWAIRSKLTVLDRRTTPTTSYPCSSRNSARYDPSCPVTPVINARFGMEPHGTSRAPGSTPTVPGGEHLNSVVPARRHRRGVGGGCQVAVGPGAVGAPGDDGGRGRTGRPSAAGARHRRSGTTGAGRGHRGGGRCRRGGGREPLLPAPQPGGRLGGGRLPARAAGGAAPPRPAVAATAPGRPSAAAGRPGVAARHHQPDQPAGAGRAGHRGGDGPQHLRLPTRSWPSEGGPGGPGAGRRQPAGPPGHPGAGPQERRRWDSGGRSRRSHLLAVGAGGGRLRP